MSEKLKVIVVDDDPVVLEVTRATLENLGHTVLVREEALGSTAFVMAERPDVVILDVQMPGLTGGRLLRVLRNRFLDRGDVPPLFILHSGLRAEDLEHLAKETDATGCIEKSPDPTKFAHAFASLTSGASA